MKRNRQLRHCVMMWGALIWMCLPGIVLAQLTEVSPPVSQLRVENLVATRSAPKRLYRVIFRDSYGYMWFGTHRGLFRYDGYVFEEFVHDVLDSTALADPSIRDIYEDDRRNLWIATEAGLELFERETKTFRHFIPHPAVVEKGFKHLGAVHSVFQDSKRRLWIATSYGIALFDQDAMAFAFDASFVNLPGTRRLALTRHQILETPDGQLWSASQDGLYRFYQSGDSVVADRQLAPGAFTDLHGIRHLGDGIFLLATEDGLKTWKYLDSFVLDFPLLVTDASRVGALSQVIDATVWVSTAGRFPVCLNLRDSTYAVYDGLIAGGSDEATGAGALWTDESGVLWIGTNQGLWKVHLQEPPVLHYTYDVAIGPRVNTITDFTVDTFGRKYICTSEGVFRHDGARQAERIPFLIDKEYVHSSVRKIWTDPGTNDVWASLAVPRSIGIYRCGQDEDVFRPIPLGYPMDRAMSEVMLADKGRPDSIWIGTYGGLAHVDRTSLGMRLYEPKSAFPEIPINRIRYLVQEGDDVLWTYLMGASAIGRFDCKTKTWEMIRPAPDNAFMLQGNVTDMKSADGRIIWITTSTGLVRFNIETRTFEFFNTNHGLAESFLLAVSPDVNGNVWVFGANTISRLRSEDQEVMHIDVSDELDQITTAGMRNASGEILIGGTNGYAVLNDQNFAPDRTAPKVLLTDFKISDKSVPFGSPFELVTTIEVSSRDKILSFEFIGLHYLKPEQNQYKCRLVGFEEEWRALGTARSMTYTNLGPGKYTFQVLAANSDGFWSPQPLSVDLSVKPVFIQTWYFRILILLLAAVLGYLIYLNRRHQVYLRQQKEIAEQSDAYKTKFLANISHEIRTPMNAIVGLSKLMGDTKLNRKQEQYVGAIRHSSENLLQIVNDLLDHAKIDSGQFKLINRSFDFSLLLSQTLETLRYRAEEKGLQVISEVGEYVPQWISGDPVRLNQILLNLMGNAIKFTEAGFVKIGVSARARNTETVWLQFAITDTGIGIPAEKLERIFESFTQADEDTFAQFGGTGLGLSIVRQLVDQLKGTLEVQSTVGHGTTFRVVIPFGVAEGPADFVTEDAVIAQECLNVLVVDDTYFNQLVATELLRKHLPGVRISVADNGQIALKKLQDETYDLVLMDVRMPVMNGFEATRAIRKFEDETKRNIPVIAMTASAIRTQLDACLEAGMDAYVTKPIDPEELFTTIRNIISTNQKAYVQS